MPIKISVGRVLVAELAHCSLSFCILLLQPYYMCIYLMYEVNIK